MQFYPLGDFLSNRTPFGPALRPLGKPPDDPGSIFTPAHSSQRRRLTRDGGRSERGDEHTGLSSRRAFPLPVSSEPEGGAEGANPGPLCAQGVASSPPSKSLPGLRGAAAPRSSSSPLSVHSTAHTRACRVTGACVCPNAHPTESDIVCTPTGEVPSVERRRVDSHCLSFPAGCSPGL